MAIVQKLISFRLDVDTETKKVFLVGFVNAAEGEGDVVVFSQDITARFSADERRKLRHLFVPPPEPPIEEDP